MTNPLLLGIEIGGTKLQVGLGRSDGTVLDLERMRVEPARGAEGIRAMIEEAVARLLQRAGIAAGEIAGVGIGFGGPVDADQGRVIVSNQIEGWTDFPLADWARRTLGVPTVVVANDAATAALGEARLGAGVGFDPVLYVTIGSGVGGGLIVGGSIYRGQGRGAIEIGHIAVVNRQVGTSTNYHSMARLETIASGWAIAQAGRWSVEWSMRSNEPPGFLACLCDGQPSQVTTEMVVQAAREGDPGANGVLDNARTALADALAHAITLLAPARVILGGGVSLMGEELWFEPIRRIVNEQVFAPFRDTFEIVPASLGEQVVVHGALLLAADAL